MKLNLGRESEARFGQNLYFKLSGYADVWLRFLVDTGGERKHTS